MFKVQDQVSIGLKVNGVEYPLESASFRQIQVFNTVSTFLPTCSIILNDQHNIFVDHITLGDGVPVELSIGVNTTSTFKFRVFNYKTPGSNGATVVKLNCYLDAPKLLLDGAGHSYSGTSNSVLETIAREVGLQYKGTVTNDSQVWIPRNEKMSKFVHSIVRHGFVNDRSCMQWFVTPYGVMNYMNVNDLKWSAAKVLVNGQTTNKNEIAMYDLHPVNLAGMANAISGYGKTLMEQGVNIDDFELDKVKLKRIANNLMQNVDLKKAMNFAPVQFMPINSGNVHDNYARAAYQNLRLSNLFNMTVHTMLHDFSGLSLMEPVIVRAQTQAGSGSPEFSQTHSGNYFVSCKTIHIAPNAYFEKLELLRDGMNADPSGNKTQV